VITIIVFLQMDSRIPDGSKNSIAAGIRLELSGIQATQGI
jgi:hypothetical protein